MKIIYLFFFMLTYNLSSQNLVKVDEIVKSYPKINSIENLAKKIDSDFKTEIEKARAAYTWLAINIDYYLENVVKSEELILAFNQNDLERRTKYIEKRRKEELIRKTFSLRRGICEGYALIFKELCDLLDIENELIEGYVKANPNEISVLAKNKNHIWNAIKINKKWLFLDVTYGTSDFNNEILEEQLHCYYFNILKEELNKTHYPSEQKWLHIMGQIPLKEFCEKPMFSKSFFLNEGQLISQKKGEIVIRKGDEIELKLESFNPKTKVLYSYNTDNVYKKPSINMNEKITELLLKSPETDSFLKIYFNNKLALQYKVKVQ